MANYYDNSKITYPQLVMEQIKKIQEICSKELRDGNKIIKNLIGEQIIEGEDTRQSFLQSVEMLGSLLSPYFSKEKEGEISSFEDFCNSYDMDLYEALEDEEFQKDVKKVFNLTGKEEIMQQIDSKNLKNEINIYFLNLKVKEARRIFRELVKLFKDHDFLAEESYGESSKSSGSTDSMEAVDNEVDEEFVDNKEEEYVDDGEEE